MSTIWEISKTALTGLAIPIGADEYLAANGVLPDQYLVYRMISGVGAQYADNAEKSRKYRVQIDFYSRSGLQEADLNAIITAMAAAGFTHGPDQPLSYVPDTRHFGLAMDFFYLKEETLL